MEYWKTLDAPFDNYAVSVDGRVVSKRGRTTTGWRPRAGSAPVVSLTGTDGTKTSRSVNRLVAEAFGSNWPGGTAVVVAAGPRLYVSPSPNSSERVPLEYDTSGSSPAPFAPAGWLRGAFTRAIRTAVAPGARRPDVASVLESVRDLHESNGALVRQLHELRADVAAVRADLARERGADPEAPPVQPPPFANLPSGDDGGQYW